VKNLVMDSEARSRFKLFRKSLRARVALGIALPLLLVLSSLSLLHYWRERQLLEDQIRLTALQLGEVMMGSLRHAMLVNDSEMLAQVLADVGGMENVRQVQIIGLSGQVRANRRGEALEMVRQPEDLGCTECHQFSVESLPRILRLSAPADVLRISTPIENEPDCVGCHVQEGSHLGVLLVDVSLVDIEKHLLKDLRADLAISAGSTVLVTLGLYLLVHRLVVQRVEAFRRPLAEFAAGDFTSRLPLSSAPADELDELADAFNQMADELEHHVQEQAERSELRQRAIVEERERIARELHDGLAQLLGYVNTKAMAVRLMLKNRRIEDAGRHLFQLEEAARELFVDVRQAILGLKTAGQIGDGLTATLKDFAVQFNELCGVPVEVAVTPTVESLPLTTETELQLLRIVQEALTNIRKHASAARAWVSLQSYDNTLELTVGDDGMGFEPQHVRSNRRPHFGLSTMRERAEAVGAEFHLDAEPGAGTRVTVRLAVEDLS
jgi:signal transduction histidine kinase